MACAADCLRGGSGKFSSWLSLKAPRPLHVVPPAGVPILQAVFSSVTLSEAVPLFQTTRPSAGRSLGAMQGREQRLGGGAVPPAGRISSTQKTDLPGLSNALSRAGGRKIDEWENEWD